MDSDCGLGYFENFVDPTNVVEEASSPVTTMATATKSSATYRFLMNT